jgi:hypothetical protein
MKRLVRRNKGRRMKKIDLLQTSRKLNSNEITSMQIEPFKKIRPLKI